jgi:hypothetical protein
MFVISEAEAAGIRTDYEQRGEFLAAVELRRLFGERCDAIPSEPACGAVVPQVLPRMGRIQLRYDNRAGEALEQSYKTISN